MNGIVSLLPQPQYGQIEALWEEIDRACGSRGVYVTPYPHFSYQIAPQYALDRLDATLRAFAADRGPFRVRTANLGVFTGERPVLFLAVVRDPALTAFQQALWEATVAIGENVSELYAPDRWVPHITLASGDLTAEQLAATMQTLAGRDFSWEFTVDHVALVHDATGRQIVHSRYEFGA
ncbi:MAG: 2'-5' RNA ligase family protein [Chloroflexi bacterium]|nr:2'-5' RNA ligase family protein [Chloroflexota bacterium]